MTGNDILKALLDLKERNPSALNAVALVCEVEPSANFDNSGFPIERIGHDISQNPDPSELGIIYFHARGIEPLPIRGTVEPDGVYISDSLFAEWPDTDGGNTIRVKDEHGNTVERLDRDSDDPVEQARWNELRDLMPDDALYFQPEAAGDPDCGTSAADITSFQVYRNRENAETSHPDCEILGFTFTDIEKPVFLEVEKATYHDQSNDPETDDET